MFDVELIEKTLLSIVAVSGAAWQLIEIFQPLFAKITTDNIRHMTKSLCVAVVAWGMSWAFGITALNTFGYGLHPALDAIIVGLLSAGGAGVFNTLFNILSILKEFLAKRNELLTVNQKLLSAQVGVAPMQAEEEEIG